MEMLIFIGKIFVASCPAGLTHKQKGEHSGGKHREGMG